MYVLCFKIIYPEPSGTPTGLDATANDTRQFELTWQVLTQNIIVTNIFLIHAFCLKKICISLCEVSLKTKTTRGNLSCWQIRWYACTERTAHMQSRIRRCMQIMAQGPICIPPPTFGQRRANGGIHISIVINLLILKFPIDFERKL